MKTVDGEPIKNSFTPTGKFTVANLTSEVFGRWKEIRDPQGAHIQNTRKGNFTPYPKNEKRV